MCHLAWSICFGYRVGAAAAKTDQVREGDNIRLIYLLCPVGDTKAARDGIFSWACPRSHEQGKSMREAHGMLLGQKSGGLRERAAA